MKHNVDYDEKRHANKYFSKSPFTVLICIKMVKATFLDLKTQDLNRFV